MNYQEAFSMKQEPDFTVSRARLPLPVFAALVFTAGLSFGCSSQGDPAKPAANPGAGGSGGPTNIPNALPCDVASGYRGDEYCIKPPDPASGFQLHYGPKDYSNLDEVNRYLLGPGEETTDCVFVKTGNDTQVFFMEYHGRMRPGSHHMLLYVQDTLVNDSFGPEACKQGLDTRNIFGAQTLTIDTDKTSVAPENEGMAVELAPKLQGVVQMHFINETSQPILREGWANIVYTDPATVTIHADPIFFLGGLGMNVQPNTNQVIKGTATAPADVRLVVATGHYHAHTVRFSAWKTIGGQRELLMEDYNWHEPSLIRFDSVTNNLLPDAASKKVGGYSGIVSLKAGDTIDWECEVMNDGPVALGFGDAVHTAEMCNVFGVYAPTTGSAWRAVNR